MTLIKRISEYQKEDPWHKMNQTDKVRVSFKYEMSGENNV